MIPSLFKIKILALRRIYMIQRAFNGYIAVFQSKFDFHLVLFFILISLLQRYAFCK